MIYSWILPLEKGSVKVVRHKLADCLVSSSFFFRLINNKIFKTLILEMQASASTGENTLTNKTEGD